MTVYPKFLKPIIRRTAHCFLAVMRWIGSVFRALWVNMDRVKTLVQLLAVVVLPTLATYLIGRYQTNMQKSAAQSQLIERMVEMQSEHGGDDEQVAFLSVLGESAVPLILNRLLISETKLENLASANRPDDTSQELDSFMELSFTLYSDDAKHRLSRVEDLIRSHPNPRMRRACVRTLEFVPDTSALSFLRDVLSDSSQDGSVKAAALVTAISLENRFHERLTFSVADAYDEYMFEGKDLDALSLKDSSINNLNLQGSRLLGARMTSVTLNVVDLSDTNWAPASVVTRSFRHWRFVTSQQMLPTTFIHVDMRVADPIENADFSESIWNDSSLEMLPIKDFGENTAVQSTEISFINSKMTDVVFKDLNLNNISFGGATLLGVHFRNSALRNITFDATSTLRSVTFSDVLLDGADLSHATLDGVVLRHCTLENLTITGARGSLVVTSDQFQSVRDLAAAEAPQLSVSELADE